MFCNKCGKFLTEDTDFCPECGNKIVKEEKVNNEVTFCNQCGKKIEGDTAFCPECGNKIVKDTVKPASEFKVNTNVAQNNISNVNTNVAQNNVNPVTPIPTYQQPVQQPVQQYQTPQYQQPQYQAPTQNQYRAINQYTPKKSGGGIGALIVLVIVGFLGFKLFNSVDDILVDQPIMPNGYDETPPTRGGGGETYDTPPTSKRGSGQTIINVESRMFNKQINSSNDVLTYIKQDSQTKKASCPSEIKSIEEKIQNEFGITAVNLCEIDVNFAKGLYEGVKWAYAQFPGIRGKLTNLTIANMDSSGTIAYFRPIFDFVYSGSDANTSNKIGLKMTIAVNSAYYLNENKFSQIVQDNSAAGHFPPNATQYSPLVHEFGHYASYIAMMKMKGVSSILLFDASNEDIIMDLAEDFAEGATSKKLIEEAYNQYLRDGNTKIGFDAWRATISKYAVYKDEQGDYIYDETIAEAVHDVYLNGNNAKPASKYIFNTVKKHVG